MLFPALLKFGFEHNLHNDFGICIFLWNYIFSILLLFIKNTLSII